ncbi:MAG TPA: family 16 glycoside hydrolase [Gemmataceae bacterium]|nr:family 16 glycoside hydrolase [Gemmataceae bacterium]
MLFNGVTIYDNQELDRPHGAASRLGEAPTGPLMLQEHGMPVQFRNIWVLATDTKRPTVGSASGFRHPGVLVNQAHLDLIKQRVADGIEPQKSAFELAKSSWEIAYNHYCNRQGYDLPKMKAVLPTVRPTSVNHHMVWETLTHAEIGPVGLPP